MFAVTQTGVGAGHAESDLPAGMQSGVASGGLHVDG